MSGGSGQDQLVPTWPTTSLPSPRWHASRVPAQHDDPNSSRDSRGRRARGEGVESWSHETRTSPRQPGFAHPLFPGEVARSRCRERRQLGPGSSPALLHPSLLRESRQSWHTKTLNRSSPTSRVNETHHIRSLLFDSGRSKRGSRPREWPLRHKGALSLRRRPPSNRGTR